MNRANSFHAWMGRLKWVPFVLGVVFLLLNQNSPDSAVYVFNFVVFLLSVTINFLVIENHINETALPRSSLGRDLKRSLMRAGFYLGEISAAIFIFRHFRMWRAPISDWAARILAVPLGGLFGAAFGMAAYYSQGALRPKQDGPPGGGARGSQSVGTPMLPKGPPPKRHRREARNIPKDGER